MNWLESIVYGLIMGIADFLPVSSSAHSHLLLKLFGEAKANPTQDLFVHLALLVAVIQGNRSIFEQSRRQRHLLHNRRGVSTDAELELLFLRNAIFPMLVTFFLLKYCIKANFNLAWVSVFSLLNGILLFSQGRMMQGNKDARSLSVLDSILTGASASLFILPGVSRIGAAFTVFTARGLSREKAAGWTVLLSLPALSLCVVNDILNIFAQSGIVFDFWDCILSALAAYPAGYLGIRAVKRIAQVRDFSGFAYYSWGISLFAFILYLTIV